MSETLLQRTAPVFIIFLTWIGSRWKDPTDLAFIRRFLDQETEYFGGTAINRSLLFFRLVARKTSANTYTRG